MIETIAFAFSIMGVVASVSSTMSFPLVSGVLAMHSPTFLLPTDVSTKADTLAWSSDGCCLRCS